LERAREKGVLLSPTMGRQQTEDLGPMTERELDVLAQQGLLPPMPQMLRDAMGEIDFRIRQPDVAHAKGRVTAGTMRTLGYAAEIVKMTGDMSVMDNFNFDEIMPATWPTPTHAVRQLASDEDRAKREERKARPPNVRSTLRQQWPA
jgi:hypothetical protein